MPDTTSAVATRMEAPPSVPAQMQASDTTAIIAMIERVALNPDVDIDKMERLLLMQERIMGQRSKAAYTAALSAMQPELPVIAERGKIEVREKDGQGRRVGAIQQSTSYAKWEDINDAIKPCLARHGFALSFRTGLHDDGRIKVTGILSHAEGHQEETTMILPHDSTGSKNAVQAVGSSTSYGKRYTAIALLNITSRGEDDDGKKSGPSDCIGDDQVANLRDLAIEVGADMPRFLTYMSKVAGREVTGLADIPAKQFQAAVTALNMKRNVR